MRIPDFIFDHLTLHLDKEGPIKNVGSNSYISITGVPNYFRESLVSTMEEVWGIEYIIDDHGGMIFYKER
tara:strand:+ start:371 stop:580 length:210 start_codon:yes stop_codon:yes gene_type:complete